MRFFLFLGKIGIYYIHQFFCIFTILANVLEETRIKHLGFHHLRLTWKKSRKPGSTGL